MYTHDLGDRVEPVDLTFRFDSGRLSLNFIATVGEWEQRAYDRLQVPTDLGRWCIEAGLLESQPAVSAAQLDEGWALREALYRTVQAVRAGCPPASQDVALMNRWAARPALAPQLDARDRTLRWTSHCPLDAVLATVARDCVQLLSSPLVDRIRECAEPTCSILFVDTSRPGRRRWCSMNRCGNKVKKAAHYMRRKAKPLSENPSSPPRRGGAGR